MPKKGRGVAGHNYQTARLYDPRVPDNQEFRGVDGEGGNVDIPDALFGKRHEYLSLRVGPYLLQTGKPLSWEDCFPFLADLERNYIYVAYFFDYDVTMMIKNLPEHIARKLLDRHLRIGKTGYTYPVEYEGFEFDYLPHKEFKIRRTGTKRWVVISDVGQFFQGPFLTTIRKWEIGTEEEQSWIERGKAMRGEFAEHTAEIEAYNAIEVLLLEQLMTNFRAVTWETGYVPKKWQGPGHLASAMLTRHGVPKREDIPILTNGDFRSLAQAAYYGGRFETTASGPVPRTVYQYDINGAYVHMLKGLPCLIHGTWRWIRERPTGGIYFGEVYFNHDAPRYLNNLPIRLKNGNIQYPKEGNGVYWSVELDAAERAGTHIEFHSGWEYHSECGCRWFDFVDDYYRQRLALGKSTKGYVLKLAGNSIYGKLAQSIGYAPWANPIWAGLITAGCRALLIDAYSQAPKDCYMLATDGLFMGTRLDLPISKNLGEWEETIHPDGMFIVQPGIYFIGDEAKTRGVERGRIYDMRAEFEAQWQKFYDSNGLDHTVSVPVTNFVTARLALARHDWASAGTWEETNREISFGWEIKRISGFGFFRQGIFRSVPYPGSKDLVSESYGRQIGGNLIVSEAERYQDLALVDTRDVVEQPDWVQPML